MTEEQCRAHEDRLLSMEQKLHEVHTAICGDKQMGHRGLVERMAEVEKKVNTVQFWGAAMLLALGLVMGKVTGLWHYVLKAI